MKNISSISRKAFSLIELLVVIAIIAILAAILFPAFARARDNARRTNGISNVKQISLGVVQYLQDYDERFFQTVTERQGTDATRFPTASNPDATTANGAAIYSYRQKLQPYTKSIQLFKDPSAPDWPAASSGQYYSTDYGFHLNESKFSAGKFQQAWYAANPSFGLNEDNTLASIANSAKFIILSEAGRSDASPSRGGVYPLDDSTDPTKYYDFVGGPAAGTLSSQARPYKRHFDGIVVGYLDGHAKWVRPESTWATVSTVAGANVNNQWSRDVQ